METTIVYSGYIIRDNGKENGDYYGVRRKSWSCTRGPYVRTDDQGEC